MADSFIQQAFDAVCKDAKEAHGFYVSLMENVPFYGGPEEGGWWGNDVNVVKYRYCETEEEAEAIAAKVRKLAKELSQEAKKDYGKQCLREMAWLERRGLDADFLPEPDGPTEYYVLISEGLPKGSRGGRQYC